MKYTTGKFARSARQQDDDDDDDNNVKCRKSDAMLCSGDVLLSIVKCIQ